MAFATFFLKDKPEQVAFAFKKKKKTLVLFIYFASSVTQPVKNLPAKEVTQAQSLGWEDPLEKGIAIHSSILAWNSMDTAAWWATVHGAAKSWT